MARNKKIFNKLVRDKIPEILKARGIEPKTKILKNGEYLDELKKKLQEEVNEFFEAKTDEEFILELADVLEVIEYLSLAKNTKWKELMDRKEKKKKERGGFDNKIFLEYTEE